MGISPALRLSFSDNTMIVTSLAGADDFGEMQDFAISHESWLRERLGLELNNGIPSHDILNRVVQLLDPQVFAIAWEKWIGLLTNQILDLQHPHIAIDGKALRGSKKSGPMK